MEAGASERAVGVDSVCANLHQAIDNAVNMGIVTGLPGHMGG